MKENESKKKKVCKRVVFVRTENNIRTTLKIKTMKIKKELLAVLKAVLHSEKGGGRIIEEKFS